MSLPTKVALVTGANKGIGYAIVKNLTLQYTHQNPFVIYAAARNSTLGEASVAQIKQELNGQEVLKDDGGKVDLKLLRLDLTDKQSIIEAAERIKQDFGGLDILINNAAMAFKGSAFDINVVRTTFATNFFGTLDVCNVFIPLLRPGGRLINVSSSAGRLSILSQNLRQDFTNPELDVNGLIGLLKKFENAVERGTWKEEGWPTQAYGVSKVGVTALTRILAHHPEIQEKNVLVCACCPGWVRTDMAGPHATKTPDEGAKTPVFLALDETTVPTIKNGEFWKDEKVAVW